ncbi:hypothetical protein GEMRC1_006620 [Eukaryota sp. GEM-RC1]
MHLLFVLFCLLALSHCTLYQVQVHNRSMYVMNYKRFSTDGRWDDPPATKIIPMTWSNAASTGTWSYLLYRANGNSASVQFGSDGIKCEGCDCRVTTVSSTSWKVYFSC